MHSPIAIWCNFVKQIDRSINVAKCAAFTRIRDGGNSVRARSRVMDGDLLVADRVVVGIIAGVAGHYVV